MIKEKYHRNYCEPKDCKTCDIIKTCEKKTLFGTEEICPECREKFKITRLLYMSTAHDCRKYHG